MKSEKPHAGGPSYQIAKHTESLLRWFDWPEAEALARRLVESDSAWVWPEMTNITHSHDVLAPSDAARWASCYGAVALERFYFGPGSDTTSEYADLGTDAHTLADGCLKFALGQKGEVHERFANADFYLRTQLGRPLPKGNTADAEMLRYVGTYVHKILEYASLAVLIEPETRVRVVSDDGVYVTSGTSDCAAVVPDGAGGWELQVHDFKYGMGVEVSAERNYQLMLYALGRYQALPPDIQHRTKLFRLVVHQPRIKHAPDEWETDLVHLSAFLRGITAIVEHNRKLIATAVEWVGTPRELHHLTVSDKACRFCRNRFFCPAQLAEVNKIMAENIVPFSFKPDDGDAVARCYEALDRIRLWAKSVSDAALALGERKALPGYKVVEGRQGDRQWTDPDAIAAILTGQFGRPSEEVRPPTLLSPTQVEKQVYLSDEQWNVLNGYIRRAPGKHTLARADDPRPEVATVDMFSDLSNCNIRDLL